MIWHSVGDFVAMGGYGPYVWGSLVVTAVLLALEVWQTGRGRGQALRQVRQGLQARAAGKDWDS